MKIYLAPRTSECILQTAKLAYEKAIKENKRVYVFSEDKITLSLELEIAKLCGGGFWDIDVLTFKRYIASKVDLGMVLSKESSVMAIRKIISENDKSLNCLSASASKPNLALTLYELISQLESAKVSASDLISLTERENAPSGALLLKIQDVAFIYAKYQEYLKENGLYDSYDYLSLMPSLINGDEDLKNSVVIIAGYPSVTMQRYDIFKAFNENALETLASVIYDRTSDFYTGETYNRLLDIDKTATVIHYEGKLPSVVEQVKNNLYKPSVFKNGYKKLKTDKISLYEAFTPAEEVENVAKTIVYEVSKNKLKYKDVSIILGDLNGYSPYLKKYFKEYGIPFFLDDNVTLKEHPVTLLILDYFNLYKKGFCKDDFIKFISNGLFLADKELSSELSSYVLKYALSRSSLKKPFEYANEKLQVFEELRKKVYICYSLLENATTVKDYVTAIKKALEIIGARENLKILNQKLESIGELGILDYSEKAYDKMLEMLAETERVMGAVKMSAQDFKSVILSGAVATNVGKIPLYNDAVYVGECKSVRIKSAKILFAVGLNGDIPFTKSDTSLLSDGDLNELDGFDIKVEPKISIVNKREKEDVCLALISFNDKLNLSYSNVSPSGSANFKSDVINYFTAIFDLTVERAVFNKNLQKVNDSEYQKYVEQKYLALKPSVRAIAELNKDYQDGEIQARQEIASFYGGIDGLFDGALSKKVDKLLKTEQKAKVLLSNPLVDLKDGYVSSSMLEKYFTCPYANFAQNILKLQEVENGEMRANETGTLLHALTEDYVRKITAVKDKETSDKLVEGLLAGILSKEEYSRYLNNPMYSYTFSQLEKEGKRVCFAIFSALQNSSFTPYLQEASFGFSEKNTLPPIVLNTKKGEYKIRGKVDRIDKYENNIRIIDYKTGEIKASDEKFYVGKQLQLYLYMNAFINENLKPAGAYYFPIHDGYGKVGEREYRMLGKTVNDLNVVMATDNSLKPRESSNYASISLTKDNEVSKNSNCLSQEDMQKYSKYAVLISQKGVEEISSGFIESTPYEGSCEWCSYKGMCGYNARECDKTRKVKDVKSDTIISAVDEGGQD